MPLVLTGLKTLMQVMPVGKYWPPTAAELHACAFGLWDGLHYKNGADRFKRARATYDEVRREPHYYKAAYMAASHGKFSVPAAGAGAVLTSPLCQNLLSVIL